MAITYLDDQPAQPSQGDITYLPDEPGEMESFARGAANNFPLAPQAIAGAESLTGIGDEGGYSKNLADWNAKAQAAKTANPTSYGAGAIGGALAPLAIPGVGEALEAAPVTGNAVLGAANAISNTDLSKNPETAIKEGLGGAAIGGTLGKVGDVASDIVGAAKPAANRLEANATANALDVGPYGIRKLTRPGENPEDVMRTINKEVQEYFPKLVGYGDTGASKFGTIARAHKAAGQQLGDLVDATSRATEGKLPEAQEAIDELRGAAKGYEGKLSQRAVESRNELLDAASNLEELQKSGNLNFENLSDLKSDIGSAYHSPTYSNAGTAKAYKILTQKVDNILDRVTVEDQTLKPTYDRAKAIYRLTSRLMPAMQRGVNREVAGTGGGLMNAALGAGALFHPLPAAAAFAGKTALKLGAPDLVPNMAYKAVNALKGTRLPARTGQAALNELNDFLASKYAQKEPQ